MMHSRVVAYILACFLGDRVAMAVVSHRDMGEPASWTRQEQWYRVMTGLE